MKSRVAWLVWLEVVGLWVAGWVPAEIDILHHFAGGATDGAWPQGDQSLVAHGSTLYGMTYHGGGSANYGVVFTIQTNGTGFALLRGFAGYPTDGRNPRGSLTGDGSSWYGMTQTGGSVNAGTAFRMQTDGSGYVLIRAFQAGSEDGEYPSASLLLVGSTLFGMTEDGGSSNKGTVFSMETDGTGFQILHHFGGYTLDDGDTPLGSLVLSGTRLYGMTRSGGDGRVNGMVFGIDTDGTDYTILHTFGVGTDMDGMSPVGTLLVEGSTLYGMTTMGGARTGGTIFAIGTDGSPYEILHHFREADLSEGTSPYGSLIRVGPALYGMTSMGGVSRKGTIFRILTDGTGFETLHHFAGGAADGHGPRGSLVHVDGFLYGMTYFGGSSDAGLLFRMPVPPFVHLTPDIETAEAEPGSFRFTWYKAEGASTYQVESCEHLGGPFLPDESGVYGDREWIRPLLGTQGFFRVVGSSPE